MAIYFPCSKEVIAPLTLTILKDQESQKSRIWSFLIWRVLTAHFFKKNALYIQHSELQGELLQAKQW